MNSRQSRDNALDNLIQQVGVSSSLGGGLQLTGGGMMEATAVVREPGEGNTAYVGFTTGNGGATAIQQLLGLRDGHERLDGTDERQSGVGGQRDRIAKDVTALPNARGWMGCLFRLVNGLSVAWAGMTFSLGAAGTVDTVSNATISLPGGNFSKLALLATGVNGNQRGPSPDHNEQRAGNRPSSEKRARHSAATIARLAAQILALIARPGLFDLDARVGLR